MVWAVSYGSGSPGFHDGPVATKLVDIADPGLVAALAFSPNGDYLAINNVSEVKLHVWAWRNQIRLKTFDLPESADVMTGASALAFSPDGKTLALVHHSSHLGQSSRIDIWNVDAGLLIQTLFPPRGEYSQPGIAFSADGQSIIGLFQGAPDRPSDEIIAYSTNNWKVAWTLRTVPFWPRSLATSADGTLAAFGGVIAGTGINRHAPIWLIDLKTQLVVKEIDAFPSDSEVSGVSFSPDGKRLAASASFNNAYPNAENLKVFSVTSGRQVTGRVAPDQTTTGLIYADAGQFLVEGAIYGKVTIWDESLKEPLQAIDAFNGIFAVSMDGRLLAVASQNGVSIWQLK
jgi:WD40 repeat protein